MKVKHYLRLQPRKLKGRQSWFSAHTIESLSPIFTLLRLYNLVWLFCCQGYVQWLGIQTGTVWKTANLQPPCQKHIERCQTPGYDKEVISQYFRLLERDIFDPLDCSCNLSINYWPRTFIRNILSLLTWTTEITPEYPQRGVRYMFVESTINHVKHWTSLLSHIWFIWRRKTDIRQNVSRA